MLKCPKCHFENPDNTKFCGNCATSLSLSAETVEALTETIETPFFILKTGSLLSNRYEIIEEIGKGGMGNVYKVLDREINEKIALKLVRPEIASNNKIIERFRNELKMARKISHKNVCRMFDIGRDGDKRYITMEYVSGEDLKKSIRRMGPLTIRKALSISKQICHGLIEAHQLGIVHRDLKPHNIMIDREGNTKIMDFGIALSQEVKGITDSNIMIGTPQYLSPEQVEGKKADQRSDIYSLGIIMFEMVTGQVPFDGETTLSIAVKHKTELPRNPKELNALLPEDLNQLILKCMGKDPNKRYQSADELCAALTAIEQELPTTETTISKKDMPSSITKKIGTKFMSWPGILIGLILIIVAAILIYDQAIKKEPVEGISSSGIKWKNSVAVLIFKDLSPDSDQEPFCIGMTESIIRNLHKFPELRMIPLTTVLTYRNTNKSVQEIGRELNVTNVLDGTLLMEKDDLRITSQLSSVQDGSVVWTDSFQRKRVGELEIQDEISRSIAKALGLQLVEERFGVIKKRDSADIKANEFYQYGRYFEVRYYETKEKKEFQDCVRNYLGAISIDPNFALAYWRLGMVHYDWYMENKDEEDLDLMYKYYRKAYELDQDLPEVNIGLGWFHFTKEDLDSAYTYFRRAFQIDPNNAEVNHQVGSFLRSIGLYEQAIKYYEKAFEINPIPQDFSDRQIVRARCYTFTGKFEEAVFRLKKALEIKPSSALHFNYAVQMIMMKRLDEAEAHIQLAKKYYHDKTELDLYRAWLFAAKGEKLKSLGTIPENVPSIVVHITSIYGLLGMKAEAIQNIEKGIKVGFREFSMDYYPYPLLESNTCYESLRDEARFQKILKIEKQKFEEKLRKYGNL